MLGTEEGDGGGVSVCKVRKFILITPFTLLETSTRAEAYFGLNVTIGIRGGGDLGKKFEFEFPRILFR